MKKLILLTAACILSLGKGLAQVGEIVPAKPVQGESIIVFYNAQLPGARLDANEKIFARLTSSLEDGSFEKSHQVMVKNGDKLSAKFVLLPATASFKIEYYTLNKSDDNATVKAMVYSPDREHPVKSAYLEGFFSNAADSLFRLEIGRYPDNYLAYAKYINVVSMIKSPEKAKNEIQFMLNRLDSTARKDTEVDPGLLAARCIGYAKTGKLALAKEILFKLFEQHPVKEATAFAFSIYNYEYYKLTSRQIEEDVREKIKQIFIRYPAAASITMLILLNTCMQTAVFKQRYLKKSWYRSTPRIKSPIMPWETCRASISIAKKNWKKQKLY